MAKPPAASPSAHPSSTSAAAAAPPALSLPAPHFAKLAPSAFLAAHLPSKRPSGRAPHQARPPTINASSLTHANGSAVVRIGDTAVVCGVRGEIALASDILHRGEDYAARDDAGPDAQQLAELGLLVPNLELATGCHPLHLPGNPPTALAQSLTQRVLTLLRAADLVEFAGLQIWARGADDGRGSGGMDSDADAEDADDVLLKPQLMAFWTLYIDVLVISLDGSAFDAVWAAVVGALRNTRLPDAWWDYDAEAVRCDPRSAQLRPVTLRGCPVALSFAVFRPPRRVGSQDTEEGAVQVLVDPDDFEESCCSQSVTVVVDQAGKRILRVEMDGGDLLEPGDVGKLVKRTGQRWEEWKFVLDTV